MNSFKKYRILIFVILATYLIVIYFILSNFSAIEKNRAREYKTLSHMISQTAWNFVSRKQYDNLLDLMQVLTKTSAIRYMALYVGRDKVLQAGKSAGPVPEWPQTLPLEPKMKIIQAVTGHDHFYTLSALPFFPTILPEPSFIGIAYSLNEYQNRRQNIFMSIGLILVLLVVIVITYGVLERTYQRLRQTEKKRADMVKKITHDAEKYLNWIQCALDLYPETYFTGTRQIKGKEREVLGSNIKSMQEGAIMLTQLVRNLHDYESISTGILQPLFVELNLNDLIQNVVQRFQMIVSKRNLRLKMTLPPEPCWVRADKFMLDQVVMNLMDNAFKYSHTSGLVEIWTRMENQTVKTMIRDQGPGIKRDDWEKIFRPFMRLIANTDGRGLGLANARGLIQLLGGDLRVESSQVGVGTTFCFSLPAARGSVQQGGRGVTGKRLGKRTV